MKSAERKEAVNMRIKGESIKSIAKRLSVSKGSVSVWVRKVHISSEVKRNLFERGWTSEVIEKRRNSRLRNEEQKREVIMMKAESELKRITTDDLKIIGISLYWAEGGKTNRGLARIANSDPLIIKIMLKFFREVCDVPEGKFRAHIHTHSHLNVEIAEKYWSDLTGIPRSQFYKTYSKPSKAGKGKKDSLPHGTLDLMVCDTTLFLTIMGWKRKLSSLIFGKEA